MATVSVCVVRQIWLYVEGWRDSSRRKNRVNGDDAKDERDAKRRLKRRKALGRSGRKAGKGRNVKIIAKGRYTLLLQ
jgi:hypothetical protein